MSVLSSGTPKCTTCKKAKKWLDERGSYTDRHIVEDNPTAGSSPAGGSVGLPLRRFFNTSGMKYRELGIKAQLLDAGMSDEDALRCAWRPMACW